MLILTRKLGETLIIGDDIKVSVLGVKGGQVRIGIEAPDNVSIHREEIYEKILAEVGVVSRPVGQASTATAQGH